MPNEKVLAKKQTIVAELETKLRESVCTVIADYRGLNVSQITELRKQLRDENIEYAVIKNSLARRAADHVELSDLHVHLTGPTAIAFSKEDVVAPARIMSAFAKKNQHLKVKGGVVEGKVVDIAQITALAELPSREGLLSMLLSVLQAPMRNVALAVKAVSEQKENGAEA